jgi:hypothetical protein
VSRRRRSLDLVVRVPALQEVAWTFRTLPEADRRPRAEKTERKVKRDPKGLFGKGTKPGPGRPPGSLNKVPKTVRDVMRKLLDGEALVKFRDPLTGELLESPLAHLLAERIVQGLNDPEHYPTFVKMLYERDMREAERERKEAAGRGPNAPQIPRIVFLSPPHDPLARPGDPPRPARLLGQIEAPNGDIIDAQTRKVVVPAPRNAPPVTTASARAKSNWNWSRTCPRYAWPAAGLVGSASGLVR